MLPDNLHSADDAWSFAVRVIEEGHIASVHGAQIVPRYEMSEPSNR